MTLKEFLEFCQRPTLKGKEKEIQLTVRKHDDNQLVCHATVPIEKIEIGFDWTKNQLVLHPSIKLSTKKLP